MNTVLVYGSLASLAAGLATGLGALPAALSRRISERKLDAIVGVAAGAMLFVISDEIIPATHTHGYQRESWPQTPWLWHPRPKSGVHCWPAGRRGDSPLRLAARIL